MQNSAMLLPHGLISPNVADAYGAGLVSPRIPYALTASFDSSERTSNLCIGNTFVYPLYFLFAGLPVPTCLSSPRTSRRCMCAVSLSTYFRIQWKVTNDKQCANVCKETVKEKKDKSYERSKQIIYSKNPSKHAGCL